MPDAIQKILDDLTNQNDKRLSVFNLQVKGLDKGTLSLSGSLLNRDQLSTLKEAFSHHFPDLSVDTDSIHILHRPNLPCFHVATNLTGLYEKPTFGMALSSELTYGTELEILDEQGKWVFTRQSDGYLGWAYSPYLTEGKMPAATHLVIASVYELRAQPNVTSEVVTRLMSGTGVCLEETQGDWTKVTANKTGWIPSKYLRAIADIPKTVEDKRKAIIEDSQRMIGIPYLWGGTSGNGIDCSGFARLLHRWVGVEIPRDADMQHKAAKLVEPPFEAGDLFFFAEKDSNRKITHVGVSLGGWKLIHSSRSNNGVYVDDLQQRKSLMDIFVSAGSFMRDT
ncbi:MAG TPA: NlpC/P60 family protein [Anaerolineales bacterium]